MRRQPEHRKWKLLQLKQKQKQKKHRRYDQTTALLLLQLFCYYLNPFDILFIYFLQKAFNGSAENSSAWRDFLLGLKGVLVGGGIKPRLWLSYRCACVCVCVCVRVEGSHQHRLGSLNQSDVKKQTAATPGPPSSTGHLHVGVEDAIHEPPV